MKYDKISIAQGNKVGIYNWPRLLGTVKVNLATTFTYKIDKGITFSYHQQHSDFTH